MEKIDNTIINNVPLVKNEYFAPIVGITLAFYAVFGAPNMPIFLARVIDNALIKLLLVFAILYIGRFSPAIAIIAAFGLIISIMTINKYKQNMEMMTVMTEETEATRQRLLKESIDDIEFNKVPFSGRYPESIPYLPNDFDYVPPKKTEEQLVKEEERAKIALEKIEEVKKNLRRELTQEEIDDIMNQHIFLSGTSTDEFSIDNLSILNCAGREPVEKTVLGFEEIGSNHAQV